MQNEDGEGMRFSYVGVVLLAFLFSPSLFSTHGNQDSLAGKSQVGADGWVRTGFVPEKHGWAITNLRTAYVEGEVPIAPRLIPDMWLAPFGSCYGMARLAQVAFDASRKDTSGLYQETKRLAPLTRHYYTAYAHNITEAVSRTVIAGLPINSAGTLDSIKASIRQTGQPQVLILESPNQVSHTILVTGFVEGGERDTFEVYDPNAPYIGGSTGPDSGRDYLQGKQITLEYDRGTKDFSLYASSRTRGPHRIYAKYSRLKHDRDDLEQEAISRSRRVLQELREADHAVLKHGLTVLLDPDATCPHPQCGYKHPECRQPTVCTAHEYALRTVAFRREQEGTVVPADERYLKGFAGVRDSISNGIMSSWERGRESLSSRMRSQSGLIDKLFAEAEHSTASDRESIEQRLKAATVELEAIKELVADLSLLMKD